MTNREQLEKAVAEMQALADAIDARDGIPSAAEQKQFEKHTETIKAARKNILSDETLSDAKSFLESLGVNAESKSTKPGSTYQVPTGNLAPATSLGEAFTGSASYTDFLKRYAHGGAVPTKVKGITSDPMSLTSITNHDAAKALVTGAGATSGGAFVTPTQYGPITDLVPQRRLVLANMVTRGRTTSDTIEYVRITGRTNNAAIVPEATTTAAVGSGTSPNVVTSRAAGVKPESGLTFERVDTTVKTIAHWIPLTKRAVADAGQVRTYVDNFLLTGLEEKKEDQMLNGSGTGDEFEGINNVDGIQTLTPTGTDLDGVLQAIAKIRKVEREPNAMVIHPDDWYSDGYLLAKDANGNYLVGDPRASADQLSALWGIKVVVTTAQEQGAPLIGDFRQAVLWDREDANITISDSHADFFIRNLLAVLGEERFAFGVLDAQAFCRIEA